MVGNMHVDSTKVLLLVGGVQGAFIKCLLAAGLGDGKPPRSWSGGVAELRQWVTV